MKDYIYRIDHQPNTATKNTRHRKNRKTGQSTQTFLMYKNTPKVVLESSSELPHQMKVDNWSRVTDKYLLDVLRGNETKNRNVPALLTEAKLRNNTEVKYRPIVIVSSSHTKSDRRANSTHQGDVIEYKNVGLRRSNSEGLQYEGGESENSDGSAHNNVGHANRGHETRANVDDDEESPLQQSAQTAATKAELVLLNNLASDEYELATPEAEEMHILAKIELMLRSEETNPGKVMGHLDDLYKVCEQRGDGVTRTDTNCRIFGLLIGKGWDWVYKCTSNTALGWWLTRTMPTRLELATLSYDIARAPIWNPFLTGACEHVFRGEPKQQLSITLAKIIGDKMRTHLYDRSYRNKGRWCRDGADVLSLISSGTALGGLYVITTSLWLGLPFGAMTLMASTMAMGLYYNTMAMNSQRTSSSCPDSLDARLARLVRTNDETATYAEMSTVLIGTTIALITVQINNTYESALDSNDSTTKTDATAAAQRTASILRTEGGGAAVEAAWTLGLYGGRFIAKELWARKSLDKTLLMLFKVNELRDTLSTMTTDEHSTQIFQRIYGQNMEKLLDAIFIGGAEINKRVYDTTFPARRGVHANKTDSPSNLALASGQLC